MSGYLSFKLQGLHAKVAIREPEGCPRFYRFLVDSKGCAIGLQGCATRVEYVEEGVMRKASYLALVILVLCLCAPTMPAVSTALAQSVTIDRDGVRIDRRSRGIDRREAIRIAQRNGINRVRSASVRGRHWIVSGETRRGRDLLRLTIDERSGRVVGRRYIHR
jgi:hypothetical protein